MQPDPAFFLKAIQHDLRRRGNTLVDAGDAFQGAMLLRSGELLAQLALRHGALPSLLSGFQRRQFGLLRDTLDQLRGLAIALPDQARRIAQEKPPLSEEEIIRFHDRLVSAQSECLHALQGVAAASAVAAGLVDQACRLQLDIRRARESALDAIRADQPTAGDDAMPTADLLNEHLRRQLPQFPQLEARNIQPLRGVNANEVFSLELHGLPGWPTQFIMRRNRGTNWVGNPLSREFGILDYMHRAGIPAPRPLVAGDEMAGRKQPYIVLERLPGGALSPAEMGDSGREYMQDMARYLACIHRVDRAGLSDEYRPYGGPARERTLNMLDRYQRMWQSELAELSLVLASAYCWLAANVDIVDETVCIVHADYSPRNTLGENGRVTGILDWELTHEGHPAEDLGYVRPDVEKIMPWPEFMRVYLDHGGIAVSDAQIRYFQIYGFAFQMTTISVACTGFLNGLHRDLLIGGTASIEWCAQEKELGRLLLAESAIPDRSRQGTY